MSSAPSASEPEVLSSASLSTRTITLNRPKALNALNNGMIDIIKPLLHKYEQSDNCNLVILNAQGRAFCAGGDVVALVKHAQSAEDRHKAVAYFANEYELDHYIATMTTPLVVFMDGITMGGGVGLSVHAPFRIATEKTVFAMPETKIGLFPDVGANFFLPRMDGRLGAYFGLTSENIKGWQVYQSGIATHFVPSAQLPALYQRLTNLEIPKDISQSERYSLLDSVINEYIVDPSILSEQPHSIFSSDIRQAIDTIFATTSPVQIMEGLKKLETEESAPQAVRDWAAQTIKTLEKRSPTSMAVTLAAIEKGKEMDIDTVFNMDLRIASTFCNYDIASDFVNGVTKVLLEKSNDRPEWQPSTVSEVVPKQIQQLFFSANEESAKLPKLNLKTNPKRVKAYREYPHKFGLPGEEYIGKLVRGEGRESGSFAITTNELVKQLQASRPQWQHKLGLVEQVKDVVARRCKVSKKDGTLKWVY